MARRSASSSPDPLSPFNQNLSQSKRKRASRQGQPRRFLCPHDGCGKSYSRKEHLARHELNHNPTQIYRCEVEGCGRTFVRPDLFDRHKNKHANPIPNQPFGLDLQGSKPPGSRISNDNPTNGFHLHEHRLPTWSKMQQATASQPPLTPRLGVVPAQPPSSNQHAQAIQGASSHDGVVNGQSNENFASWLFDSPDSQSSGF